MMIPALKILLLAMLLPLIDGPDVTPDPVEYALSEKENEWCFELNEGAKCGHGRRFVPGGGLQCELCENGISYQPKSSRCPKCIKCSECEPGHRVKTNCTIFNNTVCEPDSQAQNTTTETPTPSTGNIPRATPTPTIPMNLSTTTEMAEHGEHGEPESGWGPTVAAIIMGVLLILVVSVTVSVIICQQCRIRKPRENAVPESVGWEPYVVAIFVAVLLILVVSVTVSVIVYQQCRIRNLRENAVPESVGWEPYVAAIIMGVLLILVAFVTVSVIIYQQCRIRKLPGYEEAPWEDPDIGEPNGNLGIPMAELELGIPQPDVEEAEV